MAVRAMSALVAIAFKQAAGRLPKQCGVGESPISIRSFVMQRIQHTGATKTGRTHENR